MPLALYALAAGAFGIGTTEFVIMGLLPQVGADLGVSISSAGLLVSGYALGVVVGGPLLTIFASRVPRKTLLLGLMTLFTIGNLACAVAPDYASLMAARVVAAFSHGAFFGVGSVVATSLVADDRKASAIALMFTGLTLANVLGVPFGTWFGQSLGWRSTFWAVTAIGVVAMAATAVLVPRLPGGQGGAFRRELSAMSHPQVLLGLLITIFGFGGVFTAFTYIASILTRITGLSDGMVPPILLLFGAGLVVGNHYAGKLADRALMRTLVGSMVFLSLTLVVFAVAAPYAVATVVLMAVFGAAAFATVPPMQMRILAVAEDAPNLASSANIAAFNLGNAAGAWLGGAVIDGGLGLDAVIWAAAAVTSVGIAIALVSWRLDNRQRQAVAAC